MGAKARAPPTRPRRDSAGAEGGSLEPPGRSASGAGGLFGQKVLREQLLRPPSAPSLGDAPPPAFTGRKATPLRPRPRSRDPRRRAPRSAHRHWLRLRGASEHTSARTPILVPRFSRTHAPFVVPASRPPVRRGARPAVAVTGTRGGGRERSAQAQAQDAASPPPPPTARCAQARGGAGSPNSWVTENYLQTKSLAAVRAG